MNLDITTERFYAIGVWCFLIIGLANLTNFFIFYKGGNLFSHIASIASIIFNFVLMLFFKYLLKTSKGTVPLQTATQEDIQATLEEFNNELNK